MMDRSFIPRHRRILVPFAILFVILTVIFPRNAKFGYDYKKGSPWSHQTLVAQFDFPILKTEDQIRDERAGRKNTAIPYYQYRQDVVSNSLKASGELELGSMSVLRPALYSALERVYSCGVVPESGVKLSDKSGDLSEAVIYVQKNKRVSKRPAAEVYKESEARKALLAEVSSRHEGINVDSIFRAAGVYDLISPNLEYDQKTTDMVNAGNASEISPTIGFVSAGQLVVSEGEIVTAEIAQMLDSYKVEYEKNLGYSGPPFLFWMGNALIAFTLVLMLFLVIYFSNKDIFKERNKFIYLLFIFLLSTVMTLLVGKYAPKFIYMVPFTLVALLLEAFFKNKVILPVCLVSLIPMLIFASNGPVLFVMFSAGCLVAMFVFKYFSRGWLQFVTSLFVFLTLVLVYMGFRMIDMASDDPYQAILFLFIGSLLSVAGYPLIYLLEKVFNLISNSRLRELCDTNNALLRELESTAPGTFQHSLQVMNMADAAARAIDANQLLVRAGALYHDIGKMANPLCFIENESMSPLGVHYHDKLSPKESATMIIKHVYDGVELASKHSLPQVIKDFIISHHGTSNTSFFYSKYLREGGDPNDVEAFFYKGVKPHTKEQIILMVCDTLEAASRTLADNSPEGFSDFVERIFSSKMEAGQFDDADISIKELNTIKAEMKSYLKQMYHERVVYPSK